MDLAYSPETEQFRLSVRRFLKENLPADWPGLGGLDPEEVGEFLRTWREVLHAHQMLAVSWPAEYGGAGLTPIEQVVLAEEFTKRGAPTGNLNDNFSVQMFGGTVLAAGTEEQKKHYLPRVLSGEDVWCQGFSEPGAGSDLAGVSTRAHLDGGRWIINGQKTWTSYAHLANHVFVLARTDASQGRHRGLTLLLVELDQPGIDIRPLRTMTGDEEFNELFFTDAVCDEQSVLGGAGNGWATAMTLLGLERGEAAAVLPIKFGMDLERLIDLVRSRGCGSDPLIRQRLAKCAEGVEQMRCMGLRAVTRWLAGEPIGAESSLHKLFWSRWLQETTDLAIDVLGTDALRPQGAGLQGMAFPAAEAGTPNTSGAWVDYFFRARAATIYAGATQIQRNIVGERLLGLPRVRS